MAFTSIYPRIICAIPRRVKKRKNNKNRIYERTERPSLPYPKPSVTPLLPSSPYSTPDNVLEEAIAHLESSSPDLSFADPSLILSILRQVTNLSHVKRLRRAIPLPLLRRHVNILAKVVELYCRHGLVLNAHHLFDQMPDRHKNSIFIWNCLISGYTEMGLHEEAMALYYQMEEDAVPPDQYTFPHVIKACTGIGSISIGQDVHRRVIRSGFGNNIHILNALVGMYAKCGNIDAAHKLFGLMSERTLISWNSMLAGFLHHRLLTNTLSTWRAMLNTGFESDPITISTLISGFSESSHNKIVLELHGWAIRHGIEGNLSIGNSLIGFYLKRTQLHRACKVFEEMPDKDLLAWNSIISAHKHDKRVLKLFKRMLDSGTQPDEITFVSLLSACANIGLVKEAKKIFNEMEAKYNVWPRKEHYACMVKMLTRKGRVKEAFKLIKEIPFEAGPTIWGALLHACSVHGGLEIAEVAAHRLFELEPDNDRNFELMARVYRKEGRLDGVDKIKRIMKDREFELVMLW